MRIETVAPAYYAGSRASSFDLTDTGVISEREPVHYRQTGQGQVNLGAELKSPSDPDRSGRFWRPASVQRIRLEVGGVVHSLDLDLPTVVSPADTAAAVARRVTTARLGLEATVSGQDLPQIRIAGRPGATNAFSLSDSLGTSVSRTGASNRIQSASGNAPIKPTRSVKPTAALGMTVRPLGSLVVSRRV